MKVLAICGSPRKGGNTERALEYILNKLQSNHIQTELFLTSGKDIQGCKACLRCKEKQDGLCYGRQDDLSEVIKKCYEADAILLGSPVYFGSATPEIKCLMDRLGYASRAAGNPLKRKIGGAVVVARRAGQNFTFAQLSQFFAIMGMVQAGSSYWNVLFGKDKGEVLQDSEGMDTLDQYAENLQWMLKTLHIKE